jgi:hypothetical protein
MLIQEVAPGVTKLKSSALADEAAKTRQIAPATSTPATIVVTRSTSQLKRAQ